MTNRKTVFRFKKFECSHSRSSMKIGVDAVLIGAWADVRGVKSILDVGTGCGVIALMCAQRNPSAIIEAIDIDPCSIEEAAENFEASPWSERLSARLSDFNDLKHESYDLIISNPPYFNAGIDSPDSRRLVARHEDSLSPSRLLSKGAELISESGRIAMVIPAERLETVMSEASKASLFIRRLCRVKGHENAPIKRILVEFSKEKSVAGEGHCSCVNPELLVLEEAPGVPTQDHRLLCQPFYLYF